MKKRRLIVLALSLVSLASCGGNSSQANEDKNSTKQESATVVHAFTSNAKLDYSNMRPTYNYYLTTFSFETLELFSDNTYCFSYSSSTFSAVILPEEGNAAQGNERTNYINKYYGTYTSKTDELDEESLIVTASVPTRIVAFNDATYYADSSNWTSEMKEKVSDNVTTLVDGKQTSVTKKYETGAEFLEAHNIKAMTFNCSIGTSSMEYVALA